ncbi:TIR domain-containing protein [Parafrankia irregularis]|uniref:TIR domain-containing protein n=1 Tax=Parafrankia irregularis TaxID=795642 RepID=A0A0S4QRB6_9ACTN|nr:MULTISPECIES: toll/interleukin-1 receptor domain-containing protein [Parafrankia]MBE3205887.1 toll/interleukin-1 receptor domain-containing protein [Parafrankia sp. CH37]CUU58167.1 TIR domain-containing protein [Parafrankia irregularis]
MTTGRDDGVHVVSGAAGGHWAWAAAEVEPVRPVGVGAAEAAAAEQVWLAGLWDVAGPMRFEVRYIAFPGSEWLTCVLLAQTYDLDRRSAVRRALTLRDRLAGAPAHVRVTPVLDPAAVAYLLAPLHPCGEGMVEIRKAVAWSWSRRAERRVCVAVSPYTGGGDWQAVWEQLLARPEGTLLGVCIEPYRLKPGEKAALTTLAGQYAALSRDATSPVSPRPFPADQFAVAARPLYEAAVRRYVDQVFRVRISLASAAPIGSDLGERAAAAITPAVAGTGFAGGAAVARPLGDELHTAWTNITTMSLDWLNRTYDLGVPPGTMASGERFLTEIADLTETAAVFRLPHEAAGRRPLFDGPLRRRAAAEGVGAPFTVVIAHDESDERAASLVEGHLTLAGLHPWRANVDLLAGADRRLEMRRTIRQSGFVLVCLSTRSVDRAGDLHRQLRLALDVAEEMPEGRIFVIPVLLDEHCALPVRLDHLEPVRFYRPDGPERLLRALGVGARSARVS